MLLSVRPIGRLLPLRDGGHGPHVHASVLRPERVHELRGGNSNDVFLKLFLRTFAFPNENSTLSGGSTST